MAVRDDNQIDAVTRFNVRDINAFFIEQKGAYVHWNLAVQGTGVVLHGFFFKNAQDVECG